MITVGIVGGSGYTGKKLLQICSAHPQIKEISIYGFSTAGEKISNVFPELVNQVVDTEIKSVKNISFEHDLYFIALPHGEALEYVPALIKAGKKVIDLGGDYRLDTPEEYKTWYNKEHSSPELLKDKCYSLADYLTIDYSKINLIANPGCYPTSVLLALLPFVNNFSSVINTINTCSYSGTSGAGKSAKTDLLMSEMDGNVKAYNVNNHRHQPEIYQELVKAGLKEEYNITMHLLPIAVGIYSTTTIKLKEEIDAEKLHKVYYDKYYSSPFVRLRKVPPSLTWVTGTNYCDINLSLKSKTLIITSAIDNLIKGAAGQAIQNMNKLFNWEESLGLLSLGV